MQTLTITTIAVRSSNKTLALLSSSPSWGQTKHAGLTGRLVKSSSGWKEKSKQWKQQSSKRQKSRNKPPVTQMIAASSLRKLIQKTTMQLLEKTLGDLPSRPSWRRGRSATRRGSEWRRRQVWDRPQILRSVGRPLRIEYKKLTLLNVILSSCYWKIKHKT